MKSLKLFGILILGLLPALAVQAGNNLTLHGSITGRITEAGTGRPLIGVNIMIEHTTIGAASGADGSFTIHKAPIGAVRLTASMLGYARERRTVKVLPNQDVGIDFALRSTILELGGVVITGTGTPHLAEDVPVRTMLIPRRVIAQKQACNLAEVLSFQTGVRVENNCTNCNFTQVRILGLDGKYSQILIDGNPVISSLAGVYGLEHIPEEMVDQIEVVKGGGSSLYGGGAVAGVVNIITRRPMQNQIRIRSLLHATGGKIDQHLGVVAERISESGRSGAFIFGSVRKRNPYDHNDDGYSELGEIANESIGFKWFYNPIKDGELQLSFHRIHEERRGGNALDKPAHEAEIAEAVEHWRTGATLQWSHQAGPLFDYRTYISVASENRRSYYGGLGGDTDADRLEALAFYGRTENPLIMGGMQANYRTGSHLLTAGLQHSRDELMDKTAAETAYYIDEVYSNTGIYIQDNLHFGSNEQLEFVAGIRMDKHSELSDWIYSPRLNAMFKLGGGFTLRGGATTGFKPPQTYDEDLHLCGIEGDQRIIRNSADLKEERSLSLSGGVEFTGRLGSMPFMASVTGFRTRINDSFTEEFVSKSGPIERWERVNSDGATVSGVEVDAALQPAGTVELRGGFVYKKGAFDSPHEDFDTKNFLRTPDLTANLGINIPFSHHLKFHASAKYIGPADVPHEKVKAGQEDPELLLERSNSFFQVDAGFTIDLHLAGSMEPVLNFGVKNLTNAYQKDMDRGPGRDPAYTYGPMRPRTFYTGLEVTF
ncbi:TonB-dependent receptor [bacterium]|nr:TonB-dependent receptor [bacterium]